MKITTIGIDLAKTVFQGHGVNAHGRTELKKQIKRDQLAVFCMRFMNPRGQIFTRFTAPCSFSQGHYLLLPSPSARTQYS